VRVCVKEGGLSACGACAIARTSSKSTHQLQSVQCAAVHSLQYSTMKQAANMPWQQRRCRVPRGAGSSARAAGRSGRRAGLRAASRAGQAAVPSAAIWSSRLVQTTGHESF
jgi:hypothetical protein